MIEKILASEYIYTENDIIVDLRDKTTYSFGTINNAVNIPAEEIGRLYSLPKNKRIVLFCQAGDFSSEIAELLSDNGYNVVDLQGGYIKWLVNNYERM